MSKPPLPIFITTGSDTAQGWSPDDPRNRRHEMKLPTAAMRDCVICELPFYSRSAGNVVCLVCKSEAPDFDGGM